MSLQLNIILSALLFWLHVNALHAQDFLWAKYIGGQSADYGESIITDDDANVYVTGTFGHIVDIDPGLDSQLVESSGLFRDGFIMKLDPQGNMIWVNVLRGIDSQFDLKLDRSDDSKIYLTGVFIDSLDLDNGNPQHKHITNASDAVFVAQLDSSGQYLWSRAFSGINSTSGVNCHAIKTIGSGFVLAGTFTDSVDFDPGSGVNIEFTHSENEDYIAKYHSNGSLAWIRTLKTNQNDGGIRSLTTDAEENILAGGGFSHTVDFDPSSGVESHTSGGGIDPYVLSLASNGDFNWVTTFDDSASEYSYVRGIEAADGKIFIAGYFGGTMIYETVTGSGQTSTSGSYDLFIASLDPSGKVEWFNAEGGEQAEFAYSLDYAFNGGLWVSGMSNHRIYVVGYGVQGNKVFDHKLGNGAGSSWGRSIAIGPTGDVHLTGMYQQEIDLDPGNGTYYLPWINGQDMFIMKLNHCFIQAQVSIVENTMKALPSGGTYQWYACDSLGMTLIPEATDQEFQPETNGSYAVAVSSTACGDTSDCVEFDALGVSSLSSASDVHIYPNPTMNQAQMVGVSKGDRVIIYNHHGMLIKAIDVKDEMEVMIDLTSESNGLYMLCIESSEELYTKRLIKY